MKFIYIVPRQTAGLNNVKMVIFGMTELAKQSNNYYSLPSEIFDFKPTSNSIGESYIPIAEVFDMERVNGHFSASYNQEGELKRLGNADYLRYARDTIHNDMGKADISRNDTAMAFSSFKPAAPLQASVDEIFSSLPKDTCALQLRIERDWQEYATRKGWVDGYSTSAFEIVLNHKRIFEKISATSSIGKNIFVCCDEEDLPISQSEIERDARKLGINVIFKSSFRTGFTSRIQKSVIDFGICLKMNAYVGTPRSTFSNILCIVKSAEICGSPNHFIFDANSDRVERRFDHGRT